MGPMTRTLLGIGVGWVGARVLGLLERFHAAAPPARLATRRSFVRNAALGATAIVLAEVAAGTGAFVWPNKRGEFGSVLTVSAADVPGVMEPPFRNIAGKFLLVHNEDGLLALYTKCPHLGCTVPWVGPPDSPNAFQCPCHGSMYDYNGVRTGGPAPRPMDYMAIEIEGDTVKVNTRDIMTRADYDPSQAVAYPA